MRNIITFINFIMSHIPTCIKGTMLFISLLELVPGFVDIFFFKKEVGSAQVVCKSDIRRYHTHSSYELYLLYFDSNVSLITSWWYYSFRLIFLFHARGVVSAVRHCVDWRLQHRIGHKPQVLNPVPVYTSVCRIFVMNFLSKTKHGRRSQIRARTSQCVTISKSIIRLGFLACNYSRSCIIIWYDGFCTVFHRDKSFKTGRLQCFTLYFGFRHEVSHAVLSRSTRVRFIILQNAPPTLHAQRM